MDEVTFLDAIVEDPDDDGPWLVYADWLVEQGDPRGEFLHLSVEFDRLTPEDRDRRTEVLDQLKRLEIVHGDLSGLGHVRSWIPEWRHGLALRIRAPAGRILQLDGELLRHPITTMHLQSLEGRGLELARSPVVHRLRRLTLSVLTGSVDLERRVEHVESLLSFLNAAGRLGGWLAWSRLDVSNTPLSEEFVETITRLPCRLKHLRLSRCELPDRWPRLLLAGESTAGLESIDLASHWGDTPDDFPDDDLAPLRDMESLREIVITGSGRNADEVRHLLPGVRVVP